MEGQRRDGICAPKGPCVCYFRQNYFVKELMDGTAVGYHFTFPPGRRSQPETETEQDRIRREREEEDIFFKYEADVLQYFTLEQRRDVLAQVRKELHRRQMGLAQGKERALFIRQNYKPLYEELFLPMEKEDYLHEDFLEIIEAHKISSAGDAEQSKAHDRLMRRLRKLANGVYSCRVFKGEFVDKLLEELGHFEGDPSMPKARPNTMNNYGLMLNELGISRSFLDGLLLDAIRPIAAVLFPERGGASLDHHHAFTVRYSPEGDKDLSLHYDDAEVTLNVSLGKQFTGGQLAFSQVRTPPGHVHTDYSFDDSSTAVCCDHVVGEGILHLGAHLHEALPITSGYRVNLIVWCRSSAYRAIACPFCGHPRTED